MNGLLDVVGDDEDHELAGLLDVAGQFVEEYETVNHPNPDAAAHEVLCSLVDRLGLKQADLAAEIGEQSVVGDFMNGHRKINVRRAKALGERIGVSAATFCKRLASPARSGRG